MLVTHSLTASNKEAGISARYERLEDGRVLATVDQEVPGRLRKRTSLFLSKAQFGVLLQGGVTFFNDEEKFKLKTPVELEL